MTKHKLESDLLAGAPQALHDAARREADVDLIARLVKGSFAYPAMLLCVGLATSYSIDHPYFFWSAVTATLAALVVRVAVKRFREALLSRRRRLLFAALFVSVVLSGGTAGVLLLNVAMNYGFSNWSFSLIMLWMAGIASGSTISFTPSFPFLVIQLLLLLGPLMSYEYLLGGARGASIGLATLVFLGFNVVQGQRLHRMYWALSANRVLEKLRIRDLEVAYSIAEDAQDKLRYRADYDELTGIMNRARILGAFEEEAELALRTRTPLGIAMFDLDNFKRINDKFGHLGGDEVLRTVAKRVSESVRSSDAVGRYGGEEFLILLPGCDAENCAASAERARQAIESEPVIFGDSRIPVTGSFGAAVLDPDALTSPLHLLAKADLALYRAKRKGKNRVEVDSFASSMVPILIQRALMRE